MNNLVFRTLDKRGLCAANHVLPDNTPFFDGTLDYDHNIRDVYIEATAHEFEHYSKRDDLRDFSCTAMRFSYVPFAYGGTPNWAFTELWRIDDFVQAVLRFNERYDHAAFRGVCLDVQPGELQGSKDDFRKRLNLYISSLKRVYQNIRIYNDFHRRDFQLKIVIPHQLYKLDGEGHLAQLQDSCHEVIRVNYVD